MSRSVDPAIISAMAAGTFEPLILIEMAFDGGDFNIWNGKGPKTVDGIDYTGAGELLSLTEMEETSKVEARGLQVTLTGIPSDLVALALGEPFQNRNCTVRIGFEGSDATAVLFKGKIDQMPIDEGPEFSTISVLVENDMVILDRKKQLLYTDASQKARHPGDKFFGFVARLGRRPLNWGKGR